MFCPRHGHPRSSPLPIRIGREEVRHSLIVEEDLATLARIEQETIPISMSIVEEVNQFTEEEQRYGHFAFRRLSYGGGGSKIASNAMEHNGTKRNSRERSAYML
jgi:hypothetical protein